ncbi:MAG: biotin/lipoyl-containing protein [Bacteroidota bacterium]|nr:biotin/lipoyl-containing protein [Bacteroidota bacterium]
MSRTWTVRIGGREYRIERSDDGKYLVDDAPVDVERHPVAGGTLLRFDNRSFETTARSIDREAGRFHVTVNGRSATVDIEDERTALMRAYQSDKATQLQSALVRSPMPGKITRVMVREGELIEAGQGVVILEAMKMENEIKAPSAGIVKAIRIQEADAVEKNAVLIEIS